MYDVMCLIEVDILIDLDLLCLFLMDLVIGPF